MPVYRFYPLGNTNHINGPGTDHEFEADALALEHAAALADEHGIAVWEEQRLVGRAEAKSTARHTASG